MAGSLGLRRGNRVVGIILAGLLVGGAALQSAALADSSAQPIPYAQSWDEGTQIVATDDWSGVPGVVGYRGDGGTSSNDVDARTVTADLSAVVDVNANQTNPNTFSTGGVTEFHETPGGVVALTGSGTADAPNLVFHLDTSGASDVAFSFVARDLDGSIDDAVQQVATQYRVGDSGSFSNLGTGYVADATTGPSLATMTTDVTVVLPDDTDNQPLVQVRVITTNATGNDEWVGIDDVTAGSGGSVDAPVVTNCGGALETDEGVAASRSVSASDADDAVVDATLEVTPATPGITLTDLQPASGPGGSLTATLEVADSVPADSYDARITFANDDVTDPQEGVCTIEVSVLGPPPSIEEIQGSSHRSPLEGLDVRDVEGIVTAARSNGFWFQDPAADDDDATSSGLFVFTGSNPGVAVGDEVLVEGTVTEFRPGGDADNLTITELAGASATVISSGNPLPEATVIGRAGRVPPGTVIDDDASGDVETSGSFDEDTDGIDFFESLEGMRVQIDDALAVGPTNGFGEIPVVADGGLDAGPRTSRGGVIVTPGDFNPERILLDDTLMATPQMDVADLLQGATIGVLDYSFSNFKLNVTEVPTATDGGLAAEVFPAAEAGQISIASYNVENLDPSDGTRINDQAAQIVNNLGSPDLLAVQEVQDNNGATNDSTTDASASYQALVDAIVAAGGPVYSFTDIAPADDQDGGEPGGNIRVGYLYREDRGLEFVSRPGGDATTATEIVAGPDGPELSFSPGRVEPADPAWASSRKPLAAEFTYAGESLFVINNHFNSKGGDQPLFGRFQPPARSSEVQRMQQAAIVNGFVDEILSQDSAANVAVVGDLNDFWFSDVVEAVEGDDLINLAETLPEGERYSYNFEGNAQTLDHMLVSPALADELDVFEYLQINSEFAEQISDHDPPAALFSNEPPAVSIGHAWTFEGRKGRTAEMTFKVSLSEASSDTVTIGYSTVDGSATSHGRNADFVGQTGIVTFAPGETEKFIAIEVIGDNKKEHHEFFTVRLSSPTGATIDRGIGIGLIIDDDGRNKHH